MCITVFCSPHTTDVLNPHSRSQSTTHDGMHTDIHIHIWTNTHIHTNVSRAKAVTLIITSPQPKWGCEAELILTWTVCMCVWKRERQSETGDPSLNHFKIPSVCVCISIITDCRVVSWRCHKAPDPKPLTQTVLFILFQRAFLWTSQIWTCIYRANEFSCQRRGCEKDIVPNCYISHPNEGEKEIKKDCSAGHSRSVTSPKVTFQHPVMYDLITITHLWHFTKLKINGAQWRGCIRHKSSQHLLSSPLCDIRYEEKAR